jgi:hypothetical protein
MGRIWDCKILADEIHCIYKGVLEQLLSLVSLPPF